MSTVYTLTISGYICNQIVVRPDRSVLYWGPSGRRTPRWSVIRRSTAARRLARWLACRRGEVAVDPLAALAVVRERLEVRF